MPVGWRRAARRRAQPSACSSPPSGASLLAGFLTPFAAVLVGSCAVRSGCRWLPAPPTVFADQPATVLVVMVAVAIALLGPGAYSLDSYLFGRREIVIAAPRGHSTGTLNRDSHRGHSTVTVPAVRWLFLRTIG